MELVEIKKLLGTIISKQLVNELKESEFIKDIKNIGSPKYMKNYEKYYITCTDNFDFAVYVKKEDE